MRRIIAGLALVVLTSAWMRPAEAGQAPLTFTVNQTGNEHETSQTVGDERCDVSPSVSGLQCTLRAAIQEANTSSVKDRIVFAIPGTGPHTIRPEFQLPRIRQPVEIDGYTQPGASRNTASFGQALNTKLMIEIAGFGIDLPAFAFDDGSDGSVVTGLAINGWGTGIVAGGPLVVRGNFIGTDVTGTIDRGHLGDGISASFGTGPTIVGGDNPGDANLISGNGEDGIRGEANFTIRGNYIGTKAKPGKRLGNDGHGISLFDGKHVVGANAGGSAGGNVIAFNGLDGIDVSNGRTSAAIRKNRVHDNGGLGIDLEDDGVTPNDEGDADGFFVDDGANLLQNFPVIQSATFDDDQSRVKGTLDSAPNSSFQISLFRNPADGDEGKKHLKSFQITTNANGDATFSVKVSNLPSTGNVTATATDAAGNTSEFSAPRAIAL